MAPGKACKPGCRGIVRGGACSVCGPVRASRPAFDRPPEQTTTERGYGSAWQRRRERILRRDTYCQDGRACGGVAEATQVDHLVPKHLGGGDGDSNLQGICGACHRAKTAAEGNAARRASA